MNKTELRLSSARIEDEKKRFEMLFYVLIFLPFFRTSKSSEEDSGCGNSATISLNSSNSSLASGSNNTRQHSVPPLSHPETIEEVESVAEDSGICSDATTAAKIEIQPSNSPQMNVSF